jgi:hypothetical protein
MFRGDDLFLEEFHDGYFILLGSFVILEKHE